MTCDCDPEVHSDGSVTHEDECAIYPRCPHEVATTCDIPCGCSCEPCRALDPS